MKYIKYIWYPAYPEHTLPSLSLEPVASFHLESYHGQPCGTPPKPIFYKKYPKVLGEAEGERGEEDASEPL